MWCWALGSFRYPLREGCCSIAESRIIVPEEGWIVQGYSRARGVTRYVLLGEVGSSVRTFREVRSLTETAVGVTEDAALFSSGEPGPPTPVRTFGNGVVNSSRAAAAARAQCLGCSDG